MINYKKSNKTITSNEIKHVLIENELNVLSEKGKATSTKELPKDLINKYSILDGAKHFYSGILQNYFVFIPAKKCIKCFSGTTRIYSQKCNRMSEENIETIAKFCSNVC